LNLLDDAIVVLVVFMFVVVAIGFFVGITEFAPEAFFIKAFSI